MDSGYYAALTGLVSRQQALDTAATNLANTQTPGYRAEREYFRSALLGPESANSQLGRTVNNYGVLGGDMLNMGQGAISQTGNPLDLRGRDFFRSRAQTGFATRGTGVFTAPSRGSWSPLLEILYFPPPARPFRFLPGKSRLAPMVCSRWQAAPWQRSGYTHFRPRRS